MSDSKPRSIRKLVRFVALTAAYLALLYCVLFLLLMNPRESAYDPDLQKDTYGTSYRFCDSGFLRDWFTLGVNYPSWANKFFWPLDWITCHLFPDYPNRYAPFRPGSWSIQANQNQKKNDK